VALTPVEYSYISEAHSAAIGLPAAVHGLLLCVDDDGQRWTLVTEDTGYLAEGRAAGGRDAGGPGQVPAVYARLAGGLVDAAPAVPGLRRAAPAGQLLRSLRAQPLRPEARVRRESEELAQESAGADGRALPYLRLD
jgi:hypothetical protein